MKLRDSLYRILERREENGGVRYDIELDSGHVIFQAHFPGEPITPGACIIQINKELVEDMLGREMEIRKVKNVKFLSVISPVETPVVSVYIELRVKNEVGRVKSEVRCGDKVKVKMDLEVMSDK